MAVKTLDDLLAEGVSGRGVLVRSDLNVPLDGDGNITDPGRIIASVPTLKALSDAGAKVVVTAHLGRPKDGPDPSSRLPRSPRRWGSSSAATFSWPVTSSGPTRWPAPRA
jgi:phosphoglycerate kinase